MTFMYPVGDGYGNGYACDDGDSFGNGRGDGSGNGYGDCSYYSFGTGYGDSNSDGYSYGSATITTRTRRT